MYSSRTIGFIGLGVMGSAMIRHLEDAGHSLTLYDTDRAAVQRCLGRRADTRAAQSPAELARASEVVFTMLPNGRVVRECVEGPQGLLAGMARGTLLVDTSSSEPDLTRATAALLAGHGVRMIDAPVSGASEGAEAGTLVFMVGGDPGDLAAARPLLEAMGRTIIHVGPIGAGHLMKTVNNLATALTWTGTIEAMLIGKASGLDPARMVEVLNVSTGASFISRERMQQQIVSGAYTDAFKLALMVKDMTIAADTAAAQGLELPVTALGLNLWAQASKALGPQASIAEIARWYAERTGHSLEAVEPPAG